MWPERLFSAGVIATAIFAGVQTLASAPLVVTPSRSVMVTATPLPLNRDDPAVDRLGPLQFLGAVQLRSSDKGFGGYSALRAGPGNRLLALSDTGTWAAFDTVERAGRLIGIANASITPIPQPGGAVVLHKSDVDAESLDWNPVTGAASIVYEQDHRIVHFSGIDARHPETLSRLPDLTERLTEMAGWAANSGGEAMAVLPDGSRIILAEADRQPDGSLTALLTRNGKTATIGIESVPDHSPTDAIAIDGSRVMILHRRFSLMGQSAALSLVDLGPAFQGLNGKPLPARLIARWEAPFLLDNMEGLAIRRSGNRLLIYLISDDNFSSLQRTLLLKFALDLEAMNNWPGGRNAAKVQVQAVNP